VDEATRALLMEKQPSGEFATTTDLGELTAFLCTGAANQITGEDIAMDGGWTAR
jgi:3-hydroxybutyrate dehydrogenase